jgi:ubiquitin-conjugating enzyme E2 G1
MRFLGDYINDDICKFKGACFEADVVFDADYPIQPPHVKFIEPIPYHPNVYRDDNKHGEVCISVLHRPGRDAWNPGESADVRWNTSFTMRAICVSILDLLGHPNIGGGTPASASVNSVFKNDQALFQKKTAECAVSSRESAPKDVFERAAREKERWDRICKEHAVRLSAAEEEEERMLAVAKAAAAARLQGSSMIPAAPQFSDDETPSPG